MKHLAPAGCWLLFLLLLSRNTYAGVAQVWWENDGEKLGPNPEAPPVGSQREPVRLFGMRNETVAFQVLVRADANGASAVRLVLPSIGPIQNAQDLKSSEWRGRYIDIFRQDYVTIRERSHDLVWQPESAAEPVVGRNLPDRLIPQGDTTTDIEPLRTQGFWVDIWVPRDVPAGIHRGTLSVAGTDDCPSTCELPIELEVLDRVMSDVVHTKTMLWFSGGDRGENPVEPRYFANPDETSEAERRALRLRHYHLARRHRITLFWGKYEEPVQELRDLLSGEAFQPLAGYEGPGQGHGQDLLVLRAYGGELTATEAKDWLDVSKNYKELLDTFVYIMDEPGPDKYGEVNRRIQASRPMPSFVTSPYTHKLDNDIFAAPAERFHRKDQAAAKADGKKLWIYNGVRPFTGTFALDDVGISPRVNPWIQYRYGIHRWFYWEATYYEDFQGKRGAIDVATNPLNFSNRHGDRLNGDGLLMYPGTDLLFPSSDLGLDGPVPSIRLKNWRRGIEDVEYLVQARAAGFGREVDALVAALLPTALDQAKAFEPVGWPEDGASWHNARRYLFELLRDGKSSIKLVHIARPKSTAWARASIWVSGHKRKAMLGALLIFTLAGFAMLIGWFLWKKKNS